MPEAPEVEAVRRCLEPFLLGSRVVGVTLRRRDVVRTPSDPRGGMARQRTITSSDSPTSSRQRPVPRADLLLDQSIIALERRGKQLALIADSGRVLLVHLGMSGTLLIDHAERSEAGKPHRRATPTPHTHAQWILDRDTDPLRLRFIDPRRFGGLWTLPSPDALAARWQHLGPDATLIDGATLHAAFSTRTAPLKAVLLDQSVVAGVGNIYADESLFAAGINPLASAASLSPAHVESLAASIRAIIHAAINAGGSTVRDYSNSLGQPGTAQLTHHVYGRSNLSCLLCTTPLATALVAQRTTVWCPACQPPAPRSEPRA